MEGLGFTDLRLRVRDGLVNIFVYFRDRIQPALSNLVDREAVGGRRRDVFGHAACIKGLLIDIFRENVVFIKRPCELGALSSERCHCFLYLFRPRGEPLLSR